MAFEIINLLTYLHYKSMI